MKRFTKVMVALLLVAAMIVTLCPAVSAANYRNFVDVPWSYEVQYQDAINYAADNGLMLGYDSGYFMPDQFVTRQEFIVVMFRASGDTGTYNEAAVFTDVSASSPFYNAIGWAINKGITAGTSATTFSPENLVTREQAMLFLYRFAGVLGHDRTADEDITQAADYARVEPYAHTAISWAYEYGILTRSANTASINPKETLLRKHSALYINRFRRNVEGIVLGRDNYSFNNSSDDFVSAWAPTRLLSRDDWNRFGEYGLNQGLTAVEIDGILDSQWNGACYGMAVSTILDYLGKIDMNGEYCIGVNTLAEIPSPFDFTNNQHIDTTDHVHTNFPLTVIESKINLYQVSQRLPIFALYTDYGSPFDELPYMLEEMEHGGLGIFSYGFNSLAGQFDEEGNALYDYDYHSVVVYGKPVETDEGYKIRVYDNRDYQAECWLEIRIEEYIIGGETYRWDYGTITGLETQEDVVCCKFENDFTPFESFGAGPATSTSGINSLAESNTVMIEVVTDGDFVITNADGETIIMSHTNGFGASGTMPISSKNFIPCGDEAVFQFFVEGSENFTCTGQNGNEVSSFSVRDFGQTSGDSASIMSADSIDAE